MVQKNSALGLLIGGLFTVTAACTSIENKADVTPEAYEAKDIAAKPVSSDLVIATWNTEHLAFPTSEGCRPRSNVELTKLKNYAQSLNADIIALQEVASIDAVKSIFPESEWQIAISARPDSEPYTCRKSGFTSTQQKVAFAVRQGIRIQDVKSLTEFGLDSPGLRYGLELSVESSLGSITLLNLHMKSGCFVDNYSRADSDACKTFARQAPILDRWVEQKEQDGTPYVVLGDLNHRLSAPYNHLTRQLTTNSDNTKSSLENPGAQLIGCHPYYPAPIDHILVGNMTAKDITKVAQFHPFENMDPDAMLTDHCALSVALSEPSFPLSNAVKWQTTSKEYSYLTKTVYRDATDALKKRELPQEPWVVVMDVDETVLDNSQYQVSIETIGSSYAPDTWNAWVASEQATLVPGAKSFIETVFELGGKLALVTNRGRTLDHHTWRNLRALGMPISTANTCLIGRIDADKGAIDGQSKMNDKDLRRWQLENGSASCFRPNSTRASLFPALKIVMQVGDNIEDFAGVTQEEANIDALLPRSDNELILLPNPMYGSW